MTDIEILFKRKKVNFDQLLRFGFSENESVYTYSVSLINGQFEMLVIITKEGKISAELIETSLGESYVLHHIHDATGAFIGEIREEYRRILTTIADICFVPDVFKSAGARQIIQYVREKYQDELEFLWERFPENAIFRRKDNAKWYAALLTVQKKKLGLDGDGSIEIIDLRMKPEDIAVLADRKRYLPGYHMNKKHWITVCLDGSVPLEEIFHLTDESFKIAAK